MKIIELFSTQNDCYRANVARQDSRYVQFQTRGPQGGMLHSVGVGQPSALVFARSWNAPGLAVAVHAVGQADGTVYQCLPWNYRGWHAGGSANNTHLGVEMTEPDCITYTGGASFTCSDLPRAQAQARGTYETMVALFARLAERYGWNPDTDILSHAEGAARGVASGHADPEHLWRGLSLPYTMDTFRRDVKRALHPQPLYRVRRSWADAGSQLGAYASRQAAIQACLPGYSVFDEQGAAVYTAPEEETMTRAQLLELLGDRYIETFSDLPDWAKPEMRSMLDAGIINGGTSAAQDPDDIRMLLSDVRTAIVCKRLVEQNNQN